MNKLRWGVLGTGKIVAKTGPAIHRATNSEWLGVAGRHAQNSKNAAEQYRVERAYATYQELLDDPDIDAVYIALLNHLHLEWVIKAIQAGKHVLCEKPLTLNAKEAIQIKKEAEKYGVQVMEAFVWRFHQPYLAVKEILENGTIGEAIMMNGHFSIVLDQATSTRMVQEWGGGCLYDLGCYPISWSRFYMDDEPEAVEGQLLYHPEAGVDMRSVGTLYFPGGRSAQISSAFDMANGSFFEILGSKGRLTVDFDISAESMTISVSTAGETKEWTNDRIEPYALQVEAFASSILKDELVAYGIDDAIANMKVLDALFEADRRKTRIALN